jgi:hypothetical protein
MDRSGRPFERRFTLQDNVAQSFALPMAAVLSSTENSKAIRAALHETPDPGVESNCCALTPTLEVMSSFGSVAELALPRSPNPPQKICQPTP